MGQQRQIPNITIDDAQKYIESTDTIFVERKTSCLKLLGECIHFGIGISGNAFPPNIFGNTDWQINIKKKYGDGYAKVCDFYIYGENNNSSIFDKNFEQFINCMNSFSNYITNEKENIKNVIFNIHFFYSQSSLNKRLYQKEIKNFAQKHNTINVYCVKSQEQQS